MLARHAALSLLLVLPALASCADDPDPSGPPRAEVLSEPGDGAELKSDSFGTPTGIPPGTTLRFQIEHGAFSPNGTLPNVVAYLPQRFDPGKPFGLVVFLHGFWNCADNVIRPKNGACLPGRSAHNAYNLANQLEGAAKNAILVVPELMFEQASSDPGALAEADTLYWLLDDTLGQLADATGGLTLWDVTTTVIASHSGGYRAAAGSVSVGGLWVDELYLLDSLYGEEDTFDSYLRDDAPGRFASVYSRDGGTLARNQAMATRAAEWLAPDALLDDRTTATLSDAHYAHSAIFKRTGLGHDDIPRYYFGRLLATSALPGI